jgi:hypothetical protein
LSFHGVRDRGEYQHDGKPNSVNLQTGRTDVHLGLEFALNFVQDATGVPSPQGKVLLDKGMRDPWDSRLMRRMDRGRLATLTPAWMAALARGCDREAKSWLL